VVRGGRQRGGGTRRGIEGQVMSVREVTGGGGEGRAVGSIGKVARKGTEGTIG
jgi:hypothetical protein